ncbi:hypothetical protein QQ008_25240 [Fulvivirgaceae bacterium BMA10]|uniref:Uncharacterized protein n=1 Tax=Splendidivirga corallicola TaxID=3051826 RepID=A0ABT8KVB4_9BACT|nr:hypothetical protein [Fulvivirgaceae bacterium BMA10]
MKSFKNNKEQISICISGVIFHCEHDASMILTAYLDEVRSCFANFREREVILSDFESKVSEVFLETLNNGQQLILAEDVRTMIQRLGHIDKETLEESADTDDNLDELLLIEDTKKKPQSPSKFTNALNFAFSLFF